MKKGISSVLIVIVVVLLAGVGLGFAFKGEIIYQVSPKLYLSEAINNTAKKIENTKGVKEYNQAIESQSKTFLEMSKESTKTNIFLKDDSIANVYLGDLKPSVEIIDDANNKAFTTRVNAKNKQAVGFYLGEDNSVIHLNNKDYTIDNKTFVKDYNTWYDNNEQALKQWQTSMGNSSADAFSKIPDTYDGTISYTSFKNEIIAMNKYYDEQYKKELEKKLKDLLNKAEYSKESQTEPNTKQISVTIKEQDTKKFIEDIYMTSSFNQFNMSGDLKITFVIEKNLIKNFTIYSVNDPSNKSRIGVKSVDDYLKDIYVITIVEEIETEVLNMSINQINKDSVDITTNVNAQGVTSSVNYVLDHSKQADNVKIVIGGAAATLAGGNIELLGSYKITPDEFLFSIDTLKMGTQSDINIGFVVQTTKYNETLDIPKSNIKFFDTKFETIMSDLVMVTKSLGL